VPEARIARVREIVGGTRGGSGADVVMGCTGHPSAGPEGIEMPRASGLCVEMRRFPDAGPISTNRHRFVARDITIMGSWAFAEHDLLLGVPMLHQALRHEMQTLHPFDQAGVGCTVADATAMRTVKSTIVPWHRALAGTAGGLRRVRTGVAGRARRA